MTPYCIKLTNKIWDCDHIGLTPGQKALLLCIAWHASGPNEPIPLSIGRMSSKVLMGCQAVDRNVMKLIKAGYLKRTKLHTANNPAEYVLVEDRLNLY